MEQILWKGYPHLKGEGIKFNPEPFYDLIVGDKITTIGDGRENGTHRTLEVRPYMTYVGSIKIPDGTGETYYAFLLPEQGVVGTTEPVYCLINNLEAKGEDGKNYVGRKNLQIMNFYCYAAEFTKVSEIEPWKLICGI